MLLVFVQYYGMLSDSVKAVFSMDAGLQSEKPHYERILKHLAGEEMIEKDGALLSGGQRQRLLLAKAFLRDADIYIFDEATSALDAQTEEHIKDTLKSVPGMKTVLVIAHKEQFLELCDSVVRLS